MVSDARSSSKHEGAVVETTRLSRVSSHEIGGGWYKPPRCLGAHADQPGFLLLSYARVHHASRADQRGSDGRKRTGEPIELRERSLTVAKVAK